MCNFARWGRIIGTRRCRCCACIEKSSTATASRSHAAISLPAEAIKWYRLSAEQGNAHAQNNLGVMYEKGQGVPQNDAEALKWFRKSAEQSNAVAQKNLGFMYQSRGVPRDDAEAVIFH